MARIANDRVSGPIFDGQTDLLALAEEILELPPDYNQALWHEQSKALADRLIMLDIARSLRDIAKRKYDSPNPAYKPPRRKSRRGQTRTQFA